MPYASGEKPIVGDRVQHNPTGKIGCVTEVHLEQAQWNGDDQIMVDWEDKSVGLGMSPTGRYTLLSRE